MGRKRSDSSASSSSTKSGIYSHALPESISWRVARSWKLVNQNLENVGIDFFLRLFDEKPNLLELFHFGGTTFARDDDGKRVLPPALKAHAIGVMRAIGKCVSGLDSIEDVIPALRAIGQTHAAAGVEDQHYDIVFKYLMEAIAAELGPEHWDRETMEAWELVYVSMTKIIKNPNELLELEPLEGWGVVMALACAYIAFCSPFRMAGFSARSETAEIAFNVLTAISVACLTLDMWSRWISSNIRPTFARNQLKQSRLRQSFGRLVFPIKFRVSRFLRSLQMDRWSNWPRMDFIVLVSFPLQYANWAIFDWERGNAGVHWTFMFGLLRVVAWTRVVHFGQCAEKNLMLRRAVTESERSLLRILKLVMALLAVIHLAACLWCIVARVELGPTVVEPVPPSFFPKANILLGGTGILNAYLHAVHWAWVNLAGIGDCDSDPVTNFECLITLLVHICGATMYTLTTGNVVAILELWTRNQNVIGEDLAELGNFMSRCSVSRAEQKRILQVYMMNHLVRGGVDHGDDDGNPDENLAPVVPDAALRLPSYLRHELSFYARAEAIKQRDPAFVHCSDEFLFALVGSLSSRTLLLTGDYFFKEHDTVPRQVVMVEQGTIEVESDGRSIRILSRGDIIGKRWLLSGADASDHDEMVLTARTSLRAQTSCTLVSGLTHPDELLELRVRYPRDFAFVQADRDRVNETREARLRELEHKAPTFKETAIFVKNALKLMPHSRVKSELSGFQRRSEGVDLNHSSEETSLSADEFMKEAIVEAQKGLAEGGIPIGSVLVLDGKIVGRGHNRRQQNGSPILHAEMDCIENVGRLKSADYRRAVLYTTLFPCAMCSGMALLYKIPRIVIGENETFSGDEDYLRSRGVTLEIINDPTCIQLMKDFIQKRPELWSEDIGE